MKFAMFARPVVTIYDLPEMTKESDAGVVSTMGTRGCTGRCVRCAPSPAA